MQRRARAWMGLVAAAGIADGCAHAGAGAQAAARPQEKQEAIVITGSRLPQRLDLHGGLPATIGNLRIYTRDELSQTGQATLGASLSELSPDVH